MLILGTRKFLINVYQKSIKVECKHILASKYKIYSNIPQHKVSIIIYDEEIYIKNIKLPKVPREKLMSLVKNELSYSLGKVNNILFDFLVLEINNKVQNIIVYYINSERRENIKTMITDYNLDKIKIFQFLVYGAYCKEVKCKDTIFSFKYEDNNYLLRIKSKCIVDNKLVNSDEIDKMNTIILWFLDKFKTENLKISKIYSLNEKYNIMNLAKDNNFEEVYLGDLNIDKIKKLL